MKHLKRSWFRLVFRKIVKARERDRDCVFSQHWHSAALPGLVYGKSLGFSKHKPISENLTSLDPRSMKKG